jgi:MFS family permease
MKSHPLRTFAVYVSAAWSGFYVMGVELLGGRLLAPFFGSSVFVWGAIITVFMLCLSLGYLIGGQLSLLKPKLSILGGLLLGQAITSMPIIVLGSIAWEWISYRAPDPRYGSLLGALLMFGMPAVIAGMVSPYAVRLLIKDVEASGMAAGRLYFVSTFGSAAGTLLTAFYLVAWLPINTIVLLFMGITALLGLLTWMLGVTGQPKGNWRYVDNVLTSTRNGQFGQADARATIENCNVRFAVKHVGEEVPHAQNH